MNKFSYLFLILSLVGCTGKDTLVRPHELKREEPPMYSLKFDNSDRTEAAVSKSYELLKALSGNSRAIAEQILGPLEKAVINKEYISNPENTTGDFVSLLNLYTEALSEALKANPSQEAFASLDRFVDLTLKNCDDNLLGCTKVKTFRISSGASRLVILKANQLGNKLDSCLKTASLDGCRKIIEEKYYLLLHAKNLSVMLDPNLEFISSYLEHSSLVEKLPVNSFVRKNHTAIFATVVQFFDPEKTSQEKRCKVVKNFDVWRYSRLSLFGSHQQMIKLFELAGSCDLYDSKGQLSATFTSTLNGLQTNEAEATNGEVTFFRRFLDIKNNESRRHLFLSYMSADLLERATRVSSDGRLDGTFYDEYFFVLDRIFNRHIGVEEAQSLLLKANRSYRRLINAYDDYVRMQLLASVIDTKEYMSILLNKDQETVGSDRIFSNIIENSDSFAQTWRSKKSRFEDLFKAVRSVFQVPGLATPLEMKSFLELKAQVTFLPSTIKFIATYPAMMSLAHFVATEEGEKKAKAWWGGDIKYSASTIYEEMWKGQEKPWLNFSGDAEPLNKFYLIYAFDYAIRSDFVSVQREGEAGGNNKLNPEQKLQTYARVLIQKYFKSERDALETMYKSTFLQNVDSERLSVQRKLICDYELNPQNNDMPVLNKNLEDLRGQIHSGVGKKSSTNYATSSVNFFNNSKDILVQINDKTATKLQMMKAFIEVMKRNSLPKSVIDEAQVEFEKTSGFVNTLLTRFSNDFKTHADCLLRMHLVENFYQYLAFEAEKKYLADTWDRMNSLHKLPVAKRESERKKINDMPKHYADTNGVVLGNNIDLIRFDKIIDERTFLYSRFDILVRLKDLLLSGDINNHVTPQIEEIIANWQKVYPQVMKRPMMIPRQWDIVPPTFLEQTDLINKREFDIHVYWTPSKEKFIRNGLKALSGADTNSFVTWFYDENNYDLSVWKTALEDLIYIYILQKDSIASGAKVSARDLILQMKQMISLISLNGMDVEMLKTFGYNSKFKIEKSLKNVVVDGGLRETLFPYTFLFDNFQQKVGMNASLLDPEGMKKASAQSLLFVDAYTLALNLKNKNYRIYFSTHGWLEPYLRNLYKDLSQERLKKIEDLAKAFVKYKNFDDADTIFRLDVDKSGSDQEYKEISIKDYSRTPIKDDLVHPERVADMSSFINQFTLSTKNIYETSELGKTKDKNK